MSVMESGRLSQLVAKVLKEELREDEHTREQGLEQFRDWILKNPDIRDCPTDDSFLLRYLRVKKYSVPMAEQTLLRYLEFKQNFPEINSNLDITDPDINEATTCGICFASPFRDKNGETVFLSIPGNVDLNRHPYQLTYRTYFLSGHALSLREDTLILGVTLIIDYSTISPAYFTSFPISALKALLFAAEVIPLRFKKIYVVNLPYFATRMLNFVMKIATEKIRTRIVFHRSLEELHQQVEPEVLPKEFGGTMPMDEMIGLWKKELAVHREAILTINNIKLVGDNLKNDLGSNLPGSFRKLDVD